MWKHAVFFFVGLIVIGTIWLNTSAWFLWELLPSAPNQIVIQLDSDPAWHKALANQMPESLAPHLTAARKLGVSWSSEIEAVAIQPKLSEQLATQRILQSNGWEVRRYGINILASPRGKQLPNQSGFRHAINAAKKITLNRYPLLPQAIALVSVGADRNVTLIATTSGSQTRIQALSQDHTADAPRQTIISQLPAGNRADLQIVTSGSGLRLIPDHSKKIWNEELKKASRLSKAEINIIGYLSQFNGVHLRLGNDSFSIAVSGAADAFHQTIIEWLQGSVRNKNLVTKSFTLPDGTIGQELVPGEPKIEVEQVTNNCEMLTISDSKPLWLCRYQQHAAVGSSLEQAQQAQVSQDHNWHISAGRENKYVQKICEEDEDTPLLNLICDYQEIRASGNEYKAVIYGDK